MHPTVTLIGAGIAAVTLIDTIGSVAAQRLGFSYAKLAPMSFAVYFLIGFVGERYLVPSPIAASLIVAAYDVTVGWRISWIIGPGRWPPDRVTPAAIARTMAAVVALDVFLAMLGIWAVRSAI